MNIFVEALFSLIFSIVLSAIAAVRIIILHFYYNWPSKYLWILDSIYNKSTLLRKTFSYHLLGAESIIDNIHHIVTGCDGMEITSHKVETKDGFILELHRCNFVGVNPSKGPVLIMHGLLQDSESLLCGKESSIAYYLTLHGYDVWLGNNRGNKYSHKHTKLTPNDRAYWDFSIDDLGKYDVPAMIDYVLQATSCIKLAYIGFSQGSAQGFITFSKFPKFCDKVSIFIALAPAVRSPGLRNNPMLSLIQNNSVFFQLVFGYRSMLPSVPIWQSILSPEVLSYAVQYTMLYLFGWKCSNMSPSRCISLFQHCYSYSSVKCVSHWFQVILSGGLGTYHEPEIMIPQVTTRSLLDMSVIVKIGKKILGLCPSKDAVQAAKHKEITTTATASTSSKSASISGDNFYDISCIECPVAILYGKEDRLIDASQVPQLLKTCVFIHEEPLYEHLDMIWADTARHNIFPLVKKQLEKFL